MPRSVIKYLGDQPLMRVLRGLMSSSAPRHIRDLAFQYSLSPAGVSDIIRRLKEANILKESKQKNRKCFCLDLKSEELACLKNFFTIYQAVCLRERAVQYSHRAQAKLEWMDEAYELYRTVKKKRP